MTRNQRTMVVAERANVILAEPGSAEVYSIHFEAQIRPLIASGSPAPGASGRARAFTGATSGSADQGESRD